MNPTGFADLLAPGKLPAGWAWAPLSDIARINPPLDRRISDDTQRVAFVPMAAVDEGFGGVQRPTLRTFGEVKKGYTPFQTDDIIMAKITPCMENGKGGVVKGTAHQVFFGSTEFHVLRPHAGILPQWIGAFLGQERVRHVARLGMKGSAGQLRVPEEFLEGLYLPVPPSAEQTRIADRIDELFTDLAAGVVALERVKKKLKRYRSAVLHAAVTGRLTAAWRKKRDADRNLGRGGSKTAGEGTSDTTETGDQLLASILVERRRKWEERTLAKYKNAGRTPPKNWQERYVDPSPLNTERQSELPKGWCWANLECVKEFSMYGPRFSSDAYTPTGVRVLRTTDFDDHGNIDLTTPPCLSLSPDQFEQYKLVPGDVLVTRTGSLGTVAVFQGGADSIAAAFLIYYRLNDCILSSYAFISLRAPTAQADLVGRGTGVGRPNLNIPAIDTIPIALPPLAEQSAIVEAVNEKLSQIDKMEIEVERGLARAARLRQSILKAAFSGELVPQDPADEPANAMLERIKRNLAAAEPARKTLTKRGRKAHEPAKR